MDEVDGTARGPAAVDVVDGTARGEGDDGTDRTAPTPARAGAAAPKAKDKELQARVHAQAMRMQSIARRPNPTRRDWRPLDGPALASLGTAGRLDAYAAQLRVAQSHHLSDEQRIRFAKRWLGILRSELENRLRYESEPAAERVRSLRARFEAAKLELPPSASAEREALRKRIEDLDQRLLDMAPAAHALRNQLDHVETLRCALVRSPWPQEGEQEAGEEEAEPTPDLAFPDNSCIHGGPGVLHLLKFGLLGAKQKIYFTGPHPSPLPPSTVIPTLAPLDPSSLTFSFSHLLLSHPLLSH